jgi:MFS family permease
MSVTRIVFVALALDILAFTTILPLFPRLLAYYQDQNDSVIFSYLMGWIDSLSASIGGSYQRLNIVLFGGLLGSLFSFLQFIASPVIGRLSDRYGRKKVLLWSMVGV